MTRVAHNPPAIQAALGSLLAVLTAQVHAAGTPEFKAELPRTRIAAGENLELVLSAAWDGDSTQCIIGSIQLEPPADAERTATQPLSAALEFRDGKPASTCRYRCALRPSKPGDYGVEKLEVKFRLPTTKPGEWETWRLPSRLAFTVTPPTAWKRGLALAAAITAGFAILGCAVYAWASRRCRRSAPASAEGDLEATALERLAGLRSLRIQGDFKAYFGRLDGLLRHYVAQKYSVTGTSDEQVVRAAIHAQGETMGRRIGELLKLAEDIHYGGTPPLPADLDRAHATVREFIENHCPKPSANEAEAKLFLKDETP